MVINQQVPARGRLCVVAAHKAAPLVAGPPLGYDHRILRAQSESLIARQHPSLLQLVEDGERHCRRRRLPAAPCLATSAPAHQAGTTTSCAPQGRWLHWSGQLVMQSGALTATRSRCRFSWLAPRT